MLGHAPIRTIRAETLRPPDGRYCSQKVLDPPVRMRTPNPVTWLSHKNSWRLPDGTIALVIAVSVSLRRCAIMSRPGIRQHPDSTRCHSYCLVRSGAVWRDMPVKQGKLGRYINVFAGALWCYVEQGSTLTW